MLEDRIVAVPAEGEVAGASYQFSPSQISTFIECERKWAWRRIAKISFPPHPSAALGTRVHSILEAYLGEGRMPDFVADRQAAEIAASGLHLLPAPKTEGVRLERSFRFQSQRTGLLYGGYKDVDVLAGVPIPALGLTGDVPVVLDHKTTSSIDNYAKTAEDLRYDAQATLYGLDGMLINDAEAVDLAWVYYQTKGAKRSTARILRLDATHALTVFDAIEAVASKAAAYLVGGKQPLDLSPTPSACSWFGGCPYQSMCPMSTSQKVFSKMKTANNVGADLIASLKKRVQGDAPVAIAETPPAEAPPSVVETLVVVEETPVAINPPESAIPPETLPSIPPEDFVPAKPKGRGTKAAAPKATKAPATPAPKPEGFTLYVDCLPIGQPFTLAGTFVAAANEKLRAELGVDDYRLVDYGKGVPVFVGTVLELLDGTDIALDSRTPEGTVLLEALSAKAAVVVRGLR